SPRTARSEVCAVVSSFVMLDQPVDTGGAECTIPSSEFLAIGASTSNNTADAAAVIIATLSACAALPKSFTPPRHAAGRSAILTPGRGDDGVGAGRGCSTASVNQCASSLSLQPSFIGRGGC